MNLIFLSLEDYPQFAFESGSTVNEKHKQVRATIKFRAAPPFSTPALQRTRLGRVPLPPVAEPTTLKLQQYKQQVAYLCRRCRSQSLLDGLWCNIDLDRLAELNGVVLHPQPETRLLTSLALGDIGVGKV